MSTSVRSNKSFPFEETISICNNVPFKHLFVDVCKMFNKNFQVMLGDWRRGEKYIRNIIEDLNHWVVGNTCFMPIFFNNLYQSITCNNLHGLLNWYHLFLAQYLRSP